MEQLRHISPNVSRIPLETSQHFKYELILVTRTRWYFINRKSDLVRGELTVNEGTEIIGFNIYIFQILCALKKHLKSIEMCWILS